VQKQQSAGKLGTIKRRTCIVSVKRVPLVKPLIRTDGSHAMTGKK
jgi:hypothetical protein